MGMLITNKMKSSINSVTMISLLTWTLFSLQLSHIPTHSPFFSQYSSQCTHINYRILANILLLLICSNSEECTQMPEHSIYLHKVSQKIMMIYRKQHQLVLYHNLQTMRINNNKIFSKIMRPTDNFLNMLG